ncbi:hypothetical protein KY290_001224 [Solanum tuberosum]|uniref:Uncharacterized protein n=1 Tax=Solanum tuberosum TaxID=4113 RepID=A0ABQ7WLI1_SOLTU|nr:hypothetical protein KY290_001224 [Solanum tuberosum]
MGLCESNPAAYTPKMVSIGPYHKKNPQLRPMEKYKLLYLRLFLQRNEALDMKICISELEELKEKALKCYDDIEDLEQEDEVFNFGGYICHQIFRDLMLLENQLPFFVLNHLHHMTKQDDELQLLLLANNSVEKPKYDITRQKAMPNATELSEAGVSFVKVGYCYKENNGGDTTSLFDITFENGLMKIPYFEVFGYTKTFLRNLIAYEQQSSDKGIIENWMGEDKEVASLFNKIGSGVGVYSNFYDSEEFKKAVEHCEKPWNKMKANLLHNYFSSPWVGASTVATIILLILTTMQTILTFTGPVKKGGIMIRSRVVSSQDQGRFEIGSRILGPGWRSSLESGLEASSRSRVGSRI